MTKCRKYTYLRDDDNLDRVLCIAREFDPETKVVSFGWSINVPPRWEHMEGRNHYRGVKIPGDIFCRKTGRDLAIKRLETMPLKTSVAKFKTPLGACLEFLAYSKQVPERVQKIAADNEDRFDRPSGVLAGAMPRRGFIDSIGDFFRKLFLG